MNFFGLRIDANTCVLNSSCALLARLNRRSTATPVTHPDNLPTDNPYLARMQVPTLPRMALTTRPQPLFCITL